MQRINNKYQIFYRKDGAWAGCSTSFLTAHLSHAFQTSRQRGVFFSNPDPAKLLVVVHETEIDCM